MYNKRKEDKVRILLTGGHGATTGLAVIEELKNRFPMAFISWVGSKNVFPGSNATSTEYKIYPSLGVKYFSISAGKLQTKFTRFTIPYILLIPIGFIQAFFLILKLSPQVVLSFGGFSSFPVVFWAWIFGIPVILHEQTVAAGRASMASSFLARKIALARPESLSFFPKSKSVVTGNPLSKEILSIKPKTTLGKIKTILIMGGSRGSEFINEEVYKILPQLISKYNVIHITGERDFEKYKKFENKNYQVLSFVDPRNMASIFQKSDLIIGRSGANTVSEIIFLKRPSILIPLPRTFMNEQYKNAKYAEEFGIAKVMSETEVNPGSLLNMVNKIFSDWKSIVSKNINKVSPDVTASEKVVDILTEYL